MVVPLLALQATGNFAWLPDFPGLCCLLVALACLAHAPRAWSHRADGSGVWSLALTLLAAVTGAYRIVRCTRLPAPIQVGLAELPSWSSPSAVAPDAAVPCSHARTAAVSAHDGCLKGPRTCRSSPPRLSSVLAGVLAAGVMLAVGRLRRLTPKPLYAMTMRALRGGCGTGQEIAAFTSSATFFSTVGLHFLSAYDTGHTSPSSRFAASWKPRVE